MLTNEWFYIFPEEILKDKSNDEKEKLVDWCSLCLRYKNLGYSDEDIEEKMGFFEEHLKKYLFPLEKIYQMKAYTKVKRKIYFGCSNKKFRICRFCGKKMPEVTFKNNSHAIPLSLGNHIFFNNYECDNCNHLFGETIEQHLIKWISVMKIFSCTSGRNGITPVIFSNGIIKYDEERKLIVIVHKSEHLDELISEDNKSISQIQLVDGKKYTPAMVYRALVKIALGFIPETHIKYFGDTVNWIRDFSDDRALPKIAYTLYPQPQFNQQPELILYLRKDEQNHNIPFAVVSLLMCNMKFVFIIPFCSSDIKNFVTDDEFDFYWKTFKIYSEYSCFEWKFENLSLNTPLTRHLNLNFVRREKVN